MILVITAVITVVALGSIVGNFFKDTPFELQSINNKKAVSHNWWKFDLAVYYPCVASQSILSKQPVLPLRIPV